MEFSRESTFVFVGRWRVHPIRIPRLLQPPILPANNLRLPTLPIATIPVPKSITSSPSFPCAIFACFFGYHVSLMIPLIPLPNAPRVVDIGFGALQARMATGFKYTIAILVLSRLCPLYSPRLPLRVRLLIGCSKTSGKHNRSSTTKKTGSGSLRTGGILPNSTQLPIEFLSLDWSRPPKVS